MERHLIHRAVVHGQATQFALRIACDSEREKLVSDLWLCVLNAAPSESRWWRFTAKQRTIFTDEMRTIACNISCSPSKDVIKKVHVTTVIPFLILWNYENTFGVLRKLKKPVYSTIFNFLCKYSMHIDKSTMRVYRALFCYSQNKLLFKPICFLTCCRSINPTSYLTTTYYNDLTIKKQKLGVY